MANWGMMHITVSRLMTPEQVLELSRTLWDSFPGLMNPFLTERVTPDGDPYGGRDRVLSFRGEIEGTGCTVWVGVPGLLFHEIGAYNDDRGIFAITAVVRVWVQLLDLLPGCQVEISGDSDQHSTMTTLDEVVVMDLLKMRNKMAVGESGPDLEIEPEVIARVKAEFERRHPHACLPLLE